MIALDTPGISVSLRLNPSITRATSIASRGPVQLEVIAGERQVGTLLLQDLRQPMGEFDIAIARRFGQAQGLDERVVAEAVEFAGDGFETDVGHGRIPLKGGVFFAFLFAFAADPVGGVKTRVGQAAVALGVGREPARPTEPRRRSEAHGRRAARR